MNENQKLGTIMKELIRFSLPLILSGEMCIRDSLCLSQL